MATARNHLSRPASSSATASASASKLSGSCTQGRRRCARHGVSCDWAGGAQGMNGGSQLGEGWHKALHNPRSGALGTWIGAASGSRSVVSNWSGGVFGGTNWSGGWGQQCLWSGGVVGRNSVFWGRERAPAARSTRPRPRPTSAEVPGGQRGNGEGVVCVSPPTARPPTARLVCAGPPCGRRRQRGGRGSAVPGGCGGGGRRRRTTGDRMEERSAGTQGGGRTSPKERDGPRGSSPPVAVTCAGLQLQRRSQQGRQL